MFINDNNQNNNPTLWYNINNNNNYRNYTVCKNIEKLYQQPHSKMLLQQNENHKSIIN